MLSVVVALVIRVDFFHCIIIGVACNVGWVVVIYSAFLYTPGIIQKTIATQFLAIAVILIACHLMDRYGSRGGGAVVEMEGRVCVCGNISQSG
jgi:hypothetical protein